MGSGTDLYAYIKINFAVSKIYQESPKNNQELEV